MKGSVRMVSVNISLDLCSHVEIMNTVLIALLMVILNWMALSQSVIWATKNLDGKYTRFLRYVLLMVWLIAITLLPVAWVDPLQVLQHFLPNEIGRASCRERV